MTRVIISRDFELELELIQTQMAQKPMLRAEVSVIIKGAIVSPHAPKKVFRRTTLVHSTYRNPELPENVLILP
jgi:hypothetical protein